jgi:hypothetical protein
VPRPWSKLLVVFPALATFLAVGAASCQPSNPPPATSSQSSNPATSAPTTAAGIDVSGTWTGPWNRTAPVTANGSNTFVLHQQGQSVTGTIEVVGATCLGKGTVSGALNGSTLTLHAVTPAVTGSGDATADFTGTLAGNKITGTFVGGCSVGIGTGSFQATRQ